MRFKSAKTILFIATLLLLTGRGFAATVIGSVTITGGEQSSGSTWDSGTVTATINGVSISITYSQFSSPATIASALGALISQDCNMPVYAQASGATLTFYQKGSNTISSMSITGVSNDPSLFPAASFLINGGASFATPQITALSLTEGPPGMGFTITGTGLTANAQVTVGGVAATIVGTPSGTTITAQVPSGATIGGVAVIVNGWIATTSFQVDTPFACN